MKAALWLIALVLIAQLAWTVHHDMKTDAAAAAAESDTGLVEDRSEAAEALSSLLTVQPTWKGDI